MRLREYIPDPSDRQSRIDMAQMCGAFGAERPVDDEAAGVLASCQAVVDAKVGPGFVAEGVKTQVVAGLNFNFRGKLGDGRPATVKIFRPLPHTNLPPRVVGAVVENVDGGVEKMMVESMFADASQ